MSKQNDREPLAEAIDRVRHRGLEPKRKWVCSVCTKEAQLLREQLDEMGWKIELTRVTDR